MPEAMPVYGRAGCSVVTGIFVRSLVHVYRMFFRLDEFDGRRLIHCCVVGAYFLSIAFGIIASLSKGTEDSTLHRLAHINSLMGHPVLCFFALVDILIPYEANVSQTQNESWIFVLFSACVLTGVGAL